MASFASSILSSKDHPSLVIGALQLVDILLSKAPSLYQPAFRREGVFHEIELLSERNMTIARTKEKEGSDSTEDGPPSNSSIVSGFKKSSVTLDPEDAITSRARVIQVRYLSENEDPEHDGAFQSLCSLVQKISAPQSSDREYSEQFAPICHGRESCW